MSENVFQIRSLGTAVSGVPDQYADGIAAKLWELYIGDRQDRTQHYKDFLIGTLKRYKCQTILDVACGTGVDSELLLEAGFHVTSIDASDKMLKYALKLRWNRRHEKLFNEWIIEEANWLSLVEDLEKPNDGFDAVICLGNSFAHLPNEDLSGHQQALALKNFKEFVHPGGIFMIDHRNYDIILDTGKTCQKCIYYNSKHIKDIKTTIITINGQPNLIVLDYHMDISSIIDQFDRTDSIYSKKGRLSKLDSELSYYPHRLKDFVKLLHQTFGSQAKYSIYSDFKPYEEKKDPEFYIHIVQTEN